jgi:hypothetical protein
VRSERANVPVGETMSMPSRRWVVPLRPRRFAMGVIVFVWEVDMDPVRFNVAERAAEKVGV